MACRTILSLQRDIMSGLTKIKVIKEFQELDIEVKPGSAVLDKRELTAHYLELVTRSTGGIVTFNTKLLSQYRRSQDQL